MLRILFLMPSFYGGLLFSLGYLAYLLNGGYYEESVPALHLICLLTVAGFAGATWWQFDRFARVSVTLAQPRLARAVSMPLIVALHLIGLAGIGQYFLQLVDYFGSPLEVGLRLLSSSAEIRTASPEVISLGTQVSYFGWIAVWLSVLVDERGWKRWLLVLLSLLQIAANLLFIDRTRPVWILFVCGLLFALKHYRTLSARRILTTAAVALSTFVGLFVGVGAWVGKISVAGGADRALESFYVYLTSAYAYLNRVLLLEQPDMSLSRSLYPIGALAARFNLIDPPPSQINDFLSTPIPTNVGTFIEPMFRDGGVLLVVLGIWLHSFGFNALSVRLLSRQAAMCALAWSVLCFTDAIAFFTPKYTNTPTWLVVGIGVLVLLRVQSPAQPRQGT
jgi:oligosaccharide repeat unit polymerase